MSRGFDAFVGNPPFLGGTMISTNMGKAYLEFLTASHEDAGGRTDLVAYFFRRAFALVQVRGCVGFIATNTISQGDTRKGGLGWICRHGGSVFSARRRVRWPGAAVVVVSVVHLWKGEAPVPRTLDDKEVPQLSAYLFPRGDSEEPRPLLANRGKSFDGVKTYGQGFLFADDDEAATPLRVMETLLKSDPRNRERVFPYIGGEEVNTSPTHSPSRYVISFGTMSLEEAGRWPDLLAVVELKVKPERMRASKDVAAWPWWQFWRVRADMQAAIRGLGRVLVCSQTSKYLVFAFLPDDIVISQKCIVIASASNSMLATLQSRVHEVWARFFGSTMKDDPVYTTSDCFETFPFPQDLDARPALDLVGRDYYEFRAALMVRKDEGLTKTYNRFHDPDERSPDIFKLRELHAQMDRAVLDAYGWNDIQPAYDFREQLDESIRLTWNDDTRDEVLARLLELNRVLAEKDPKERPKKPPATKPDAKKASAKKKGKTKSLALPGVEPEDT